MNLPGLPSISGMVKVAANQFLVVHDGKRPNEPRLGVIDVEEKKGLGYREISIDKWPSNEKPPNDVEGICAIPGRNDEYLLAESGFYPGHGKFGRVIKIAYPRGKTLDAAEYMGSFRPLPAPPNNVDTPRPAQIEGIAVVVQHHFNVLLLALRGGKETPEEKKIIAGQLIWGTLTGVDTSTPTFTKSGTAPLSYKPIADRGAADLYVMPYRTDKWKVYSVATSDPGDFGDQKDLGPFRSAVYLAGTLTIGPAKILFKPLKAKKIVHWDFEGLKVEAIAAPAEMFKESGGLSIATDDELYNGIWRPISKSTVARSPSPLLFTKNAKEGFYLK